MFPRKLIADLALVAFKTCCAVATAVAVLWTFLIVGPHVETRFNPVTSKVTITAVEDVAGGKSALVWATFTKYRNCEFVGLSWYRGAAAGGFQRVPVVLPRPTGDVSTLTRPLGWQVGGPWEIGMPATEIPHGSFARLAHRCHVFWITMTEFYP